MIRNKSGMIVALAGAALGFAACSEDVPSTAPLLRKLTAVLSPANEVPPVTANSSGTSNVTVVTERNVSNGKLDTTTVRVQTLVSNLDSVTVGHIHAGAAGVAGPVIVNLLPTYGLVRGQRVARTLPDSSTTINGSLSFVDITRASTFSAPFNFDSLLARINAGTAYVNIHTIKNPGGEIRGQIAP